ncbi:MAG: F0F1 ATP synthase subunit gamma [Thermoleophilia bacterium]|nr:F0F1 ATP synthase subunit gamma [Thermoleophilia bacterium]
MPTLESLRNRIDTGEDMQSIVGAMKVLAMAGIRRMEQSLAALSVARRAVELGLQGALMNRPRDVEFGNGPAGRLCAIIFGSEQVLSGQFNEQIVEYFQEWLDGLERSGPGQLTVLAMGEHVNYRLASARVPVSRHFPLPGSMAMARGTAHDVFIHLEDLRRRELLDRVTLFFHRPRSGASYRPVAINLYPPDPEWLEELAARPWPSRSRPEIVMNWRELFTALASNYLFISLHGAFVESLMSENSSRLLAMQVAERNIGEYLDDLKRQLNHQRQGQITAELLDIVAGSEALFGGIEEEEYGQEIYALREESPYPGQLG